MALSPTSSRGSSSSGVTEIALVTFTSTVTVASTSEAAPTTVVSAGAQTFTGAVVKIEVFLPTAVVASTTNTSPFIFFNLWDAAVESGRWGFIQAPNMSAGNWASPLYLSRFVTPSAGSHTYLIRAWKGGTASTADVQAGSGAAGNQPPGFIRITTGG